MRRILFFRRLKENVRASGVYLACAFMIVLLMGACASEYKKQTSFEIPPPPSPGEVSVPNPNETSQVSAEGEPENGVTELTRIPTLPVQPQVPAKIESVNGETSDDQEIVCRSITVTGSRIKRRRICATRAQWVSWREEQRRKTEELYRDARSGDVNTLTGDPNEDGVGHMPH